uniref:Uncharacterized protein n=1 Tax=Meloidogyne incognita TaxID=6306 RepID=A0A914N2Z1_MELIC
MKNLLLLDTLRSRETTGKFVERVVLYHPENSLSWKIVITARGLNVAINVLMKKKEQLKCINIRMCGRIFNRTRYSKTSLLRKWHKKCLGL